ncbi:hypothetical protein H0H93_002655, partial [Arthromyces matolae]
MSYNNDNTDNYNTGSTGFGAPFFYSFSSTLLLTYRSCRKEAAKGNKAKASTTPTSEVARTNTARARTRAASVTTRPLSNRAPTGLPATLAASSEAAT